MDIGIGRRQDSTCWFKEPWNRAISLERTAKKRFIFPSTAKAAKPRELVNNRVSDIPFRN